MKYNFSKKFGDEIFGVSEAHSFDEAIKAVEKGIYDRSLQQNKSVSPQILKVNSTILNETIIPVATLTPGNETITIKKDETTGNPTT